MPLAHIISRLRLRYQDPHEEKEYHLLKIPLLKDFFKCLFACIALYYIPVTARYFTKDLYPQSYIGIGILVLSVVLFFIRFKLTRWLEWISIAYVTLIIAVGIYNVRLLVDKSSFEVFYMGYSFALVHRLIDYRIVNFQVLLLFNILFTTLKFTLIEMPNAVLGINIVCLEVFPIILNYITEKGDRSLFDSLYRSKQQLLKFKNFLTEYLPNQMAIFSSDYTHCHFMNDAFKTMFKYENISQLKNFLQKFVIEEEDVEKNRFFLSLLGGKNFLNAPLGLSDFLDLLTSQTRISRNFKGISFQVIETNSAQDKSKSGNSVSPNVVSDGSAQDKGTLPVKKSLSKKEIEKPSQKYSQRDDSYSHAQKQDSQAENFINSKDALNGPEEQGINEGFDSDSQKSPASPRRRVLKVKVFPIIWDNVDAIALIVDDVTHERTIMELKIADKNKDLVIATISHELRTPLNGMLGLINIVEKRLKQSDVFPYLDACKQSSLLLLSLVNSILDLSLIRKNKLRLNYAEVSLESLFSDIKNLFASFCTSKGLYLRTEIDPKISSTFITDRDRVNQILVNLIGNAFKFTFKGGITIIAKLESKNPVKIKINVEDTGIGIKKDDQEKLFKMFARIEHKDRAINTNGVGLGLSISYNLAEMLNPSDRRGIEVKSNFGKGSVFSFYIEHLQNIYNKNDEESEDRGDDSMIINENTGTMTIVDKIATYTDTKDKIGLPRTTTLDKDQVTKLISKEAVKERPWCLIVDDNPFNLMVANHIMEERGYSVENAMNGKEAISKFQLYQNSEKSFNIVLMDCQMPIMDGYEATKILKTMMKEGKLNDCPIIALTANTRNDKHDRLFDESGMNGYIAKPLQIKELDEVLKEVQKRKRKKKEAINLNDSQAKLIQS